MAEIKGKSKSGRYDVKGKSSVFWILAPVLYVLVAQPDPLLSYATFTSLIIALVVGVVLDLILAFVMFAYISDSR